jgi:hypothetical protein
MELRLKTTLVSSLGCLALVITSMFIWHRQITRDAAACRALAEQGNAESQFKLGSMYYHGRGVSKDYTEAARWFTKAAEQGDAKAQDGLGFTYLQGQGVTRDYTEAARWYKKSAEQGYAKSEYDLGYMYYHGYGVPQDRTEANRLLRQAAAQGNGQARQLIHWGRGYFPKVSELVLWLKFIVGLYFVSQFLKPTNGHRTRSQIITAVTALLLIASFALDLFRYLYTHLLESLTTVGALYVPFCATIGRATTAEGPGFWPVSEFDSGCVVLNFLRLKILPLND